MDSLNLQLPNGKPVSVELLDEQDEQMEIAANPEAGVFGFESENQTVTVFLKAREG